MQRNWTVIRDLLEHFEDETIEGFLSEIKQGHRYDSTLTPEENQLAQADSERKADIVFGHLLLLTDSELIEGVIRVQPTLGKWSYSLRNPRLTMKGHDALDAIRSDTVWNEVKAKAKEAALPVTLELILAVLRKMSLLA